MVQSTRRAMVFSALPFYLFAVKLGSRGSNKQSNFLGELRVLDHTSESDERVDRQGMDRLGIQDRNLRGEWGRSYIRTGQSAFVTENIGH